MLTMKDIIKEGHPTLRQIADDVVLPASEEDKQTLKEMMEFLKNSQDPDIANKYDLRSGIGLAAPQINISKRMIALRVEDHNENLIDIGLFNPKVKSHSIETSYLENGEGCLSVDRDVEGIVPRYARIKVEGTTIDGETVTLKLKGLPAIAIQHELDHLNGIMFYDRIEQDDPYKKELPHKEMITLTSTATAL